MPGGFFMSALFASDLLAANEGDGLKAKRQEIFCVPGCHAKTAAHAAHRSSLGHP
jgi:hypothetical protein